MQAIVRLLHTPLSCLGYVPCGLPAPFQMTSSHNDKAGRVRPRYRISKTGPPSLCAAMVMAGKYKLQDAKSLVAIVMKHSADIEKETANYGKATTNVDAAQYIAEVQGSSVEDGKEWLVTKDAGVQLADLADDKDIWDCVCQAVDAIEALEKAGLRHSDVSPYNIGCRKKTRWSRFWDLATLRELTSIALGLLKTSMGPYDGDDCSLQA